MTFDPVKARADFPILFRTLPSGRKLVYLDNAATTQKPEQVISAMTMYYELMNSNVHRAVHTLAGEATEAYETSRNKIADWFCFRELPEAHSRAVVSGPHCTI